MALQGLSGKRPCRLDTLLTAQLTEHDIEEVQRWISGLMGPQDSKPLFGHSCCDVIVHQCLPHQTGKLWRLFEHRKQALPLADCITSRHA